MKPGEIALTSLIQEFFSCCQTKIDRLFSNELSCKDNSNLIKQLHIYDDNSFRQILLSLRLSAEHSLPSIVQAMYDWHQSQHSFGVNLNVVNIHIVADMYAEVVGVISQNKLKLVEQKFKAQLAELRARDINSHNINCIRSLIKGMKFFRVKMYPIEDFEECFQFLHVLARYFLEVKEKEIKYALADLFFDVLLPVASEAKTEINIPALKNFVEMLYIPCSEMAAKKKHVFDLLQMATCLLCVATKPFFLTHMPALLNNCLSSIKSRDPKIAEIGIGSLFRLFWVYIIRFKGEKHSETQNRLQLIVNGLFPKNSRGIVPKDANPAIFIRIIEIISHDRLDFAVKEIILDLISTKSSKNIQPERMNIGLSAFLVIANQLQQRNQEMESGNYASSPHNTANPLIMLPHSILSNPLVNRRTNQSAPMMESLASISNISPYLSQVRSAFDTILRLLDTNPVMNTNSSLIGLIIEPNDPQNPNRSASASSDLSINILNSIGEDGHHKLALLRTCLACIPRLMPIQLTKTEFIEILTKTTLNIFDDIRQMAQQAMVNLILEVPSYRLKTISTYIEFIQKNVTDQQHGVMECCLKTLILMLQNWRTVLNKENVMSLTNNEHSPIFQAEGFALVNLCSCRQTTRRLAIQILKECRKIHKVLNSFKNRSNFSSSSNLLLNQTPLSQHFTVSVSEVLDMAVPTILHKIMPLLDVSDRNSLLQAISEHDQHYRETKNSDKDHENLISWDFNVFIERASSVWYSGYRYHSKNFCGPRISQVATQSHNLVNQSSINQMNETPVKKSKNDSIQNEPSDLSKYLINPINCVLEPRHSRMNSTDIWGIILSTVSGVEFLLSACPMAMTYAWDYLSQIIHPISQCIDPNTAITENRASSILRTSTKRHLTTPHERDSLQHLWHNYISMACSIFPSTTGIIAAPIKNYLPETLLVNVRNNLKTSQANIKLSESNINTSPHDLPNTHHNNALGKKIGAFNPFRSDDSSQQNQSGLMANTKEDASTPAAKENQTNFQTNQTMNRNYVLNINKENTRELIKSLFNFLKCDNVEIRNSAIIALSRLNPSVFRDLMDEMNAHIKQIISKKQESIRRRNRKDTLRCSIVQLFANLSMNGIFCYQESGIITNNQLNPCVVEFIDGIRNYLELMVDHNSWVMSQTITPPTPFLNNDSLTNSLEFKKISNISNNDCAIDLSPTSQKQILNPGSSPQGIDITLPNSSNTLNSTMTTSNTSVNQSSINNSSNTVQPIANSISSQNTLVNQVSTQSTPQPPQTPSNSNSNQVDSYILAHTRLYFVSFIRDLLSFLCDAKPNTNSVLSSQSRHSLFILFSRWSACYDAIMSKFHPEHVVTGPPISWPTYGDVISLHNSNLLSHVLPQIRFAQESSLLPGIHVINQYVNKQNKLNFGYSNTPSITNSGRFNYENSALIDYNLWFELIWTTNQAMVMILCSGPIYDNLSVDTVISPFHHGPSSIQNPCQQMANFKEFANVINLHSMSPQPGYIFRYIEQLVNAKDPSLSEIPYLANSPTLLSHYQLSTGSPLVFGSQLACNSIFSRNLDASQSFLRFLNISNISTEISPIPIHSYLNHLTEDVKKVTVFENQVISSLGFERLDYLFQQLGEEALFTFLLKNNFQANLMKWVIDNCYSSRLTGTYRACFNVLYKIITNDTLANLKFENNLEQLITLVLVHSFDNSKEIFNKALIMFQSLYYQYFLLENHLIQTEKEERESSPLIEKSPNQEKIFIQDYGTMELFWRSIQQLSNPVEILKQFTGQHPDFTLPIFSEVTMRLLNCRNNLVPHLFKILEYLLINIELVDLIPLLPKNASDKSRAQNQQTPETKDTRNKAESEKIMENEWNGIIDDDKISQKSFSSANKTPMENQPELDVIKSNKPLVCRNRRRNKTNNTPVRNKETMLIKNRLFSQNNRNDYTSDANSSQDFTKGSSNRSSLPPNIREKHSDSIVRQREFCSVEDFSKVYDKLSNYSVEILQEEANDFLDRDKDFLLTHSLRSSPQISCKEGYQKDDECFLNQQSPFIDKHQSDNVIFSSIPITFRISGTGSKAATEYVMNNMLFLTIHFSQASELYGNSEEFLENCWRILVRYRACNLNVIIQYLMVFLSLAPTILIKFIKKIISFLSNERPDELFDELVHSLNTIDGINLNIEPIEVFPYFIISKNENQLPSKLFNPSEKEEDKNIATRDSAGDSDNRKVLAKNRQRQRNLSEQFGYPPSRGKPYRQNQLEDIQSSEFSSVEDEDQANILHEDYMFSPPNNSQNFNQRRSLTFEHETRQYSRLKARPSSIALSTSPMDREFDSQLKILSEGDLNNEQKKKKINTNWELPSAQDKYRSDITLADSNKDGSLIETTKSSVEEQTTPLQLSKSAIKLKTMTLPYNSTSKERYYRLKNRNAEPCNCLENSSSNDECVDCSNKNLEKFKQMLLYTNSLPPKLVSLPSMSFPISSQLTSLPNIYLLNVNKSRAQLQTNNSSMNSAHSTCSTEPTKINMSDIFSHPNQLPMPTNGGFKAPIKSWILGESIVISGYGNHLTKYSGSWTVQNMNTSLIPLILIMISEILENELIKQSPDEKVKKELSLNDFIVNLPMILLFTLLSVDHSRPLVQEECKSILLNILRLSNGNHIDNLKSSLLNIQWSLGQKEPQFDNVYEDVKLNKFQRKDSIVDYYAERLDSLHLNNPLDVNISIKAKNLLAYAGNISKIEISKGLLNQLAEANLSNGQLSYNLMNRLHQNFGNSNQSGDINPPNEIIQSTTSLNVKQNTLGSKINGQRQHSFRNKTLPATSPQFNLFMSSLSTGIINKSNIEFQYFLSRKIDSIFNMRFSLPLWSWEDLTTQKYTQRCNSKISASLYTEDDCEFISCFSSENKAIMMNSCELMNEFLETFLQFFLISMHHEKNHSCLCFNSNNSSPSDCIIGRFSRMSLQMGLTCYNRHYSLRSLQIFRSLGVHLNINMISDILTRLIHCFSEINEDTQVYICEVFLTLEAGISHLQEIYKFIPKHKLFFDISLYNTASSSVSPSSSKLSQSLTGSQSSPNTRGHDHPRRHSRSGMSCQSNEEISHTSTVRRHLAPHVETSEVENEQDPSAETSTTKEKSNSYKPSPLKSHPQEFLTSDQLIDVLNSSFWISICLLDSDYDFKYLTGLQMLDKLLPIIYPDNEYYLDQKSRSNKDFHKNLIDRLENTIDKFTGWDGKFPGILTLLTRGLANESFINSCYRVLIKALPLLYSSKKLAIGYQYKAKIALNSEKIFTQLILTFMPLLMLAWHENSTCEQKNDSTNGQNPPTRSTIGQKDQTNATSLNYEFGTWMNTSNYEITIADPTGNQFASLLQNSTILPSIQMLICPLVFQQQNSSCQNNISFGCGPLPPNQSAFTSPSNTHITPAYHYTQQQYAGSQHSSTKNLFRIKNPVCILAADILSDLFSNNSTDEVGNLTTGSTRFYHLSTILKMYANQTFNRDSIHWSKCVIFHLIEGSSQAIYPYILSTLDAYITHGPVCFHVPALHMAYWTLHKCNDFHNADFSDELCHFIHTITQKFKNTCIWSEVMSLYQLVINRSSVISSIPQNMLNSMNAFSGLKNSNDSNDLKMNSYLNPLGSIGSSNAYGLSSMVSIPTPELEGPRIELSGKVLDHTFNISRICPLLASNIIFFPNQSVSSTLNSKPFHQEPIKPNYSEGWIIAFMNSRAGFANPALSQTRTKHRFQALLFCLCSNAPTDFKSPSVIFSQSIETLDHQISVHSSSETASVTEPSHIEEINQPQQSKEENNTTNPYPDISNYFNENISKINFVDVTFNAWDNDKSNMNDPRGHSIDSSYDIDDDFKEHNPKISSMPNLTLIGDQSSETTKESANNLSVHLSPSLNEDTECGTITEKNISLEFKQLLKEDSIIDHGFSKAEYGHCKSANHSIDFNSTLPSKKQWQSNDSLNGSQIIHGTSRIRESSGSQRNSSNEKSINQSRNQSICSDTDSLQMRQFDAIAEFDKILADGSIESSSSDDFESHPFQRYFNNKSTRERSNLFNMVQTNPENLYEEYHVEESELVSIIENSDEAKKNQTLVDPHGSSTPLNDLRKSDDVYEEVDPYQTLNSQPKNFYNDLYQANSDSQSSDASLKDRIENSKREEDKPGNSSETEFSIWRDVAEEKTTQFEMVLSNNITEMSTEPRNEKTLYKLRKVILSLSTYFTICQQRICCHGIQRAYCAFNNCAPDSDLDASWQMGHFKSQAELMLTHLQIPLLISTQNLTNIDLNHRSVNDIFEKLESLMNSIREQKSDSDKLFELIENIDVASNNSLLNKRIKITESIKKSLASLLRLYQSINYILKAYYALMQFFTNDEGNVSDDLKGLSELLVSCSGRLASSNPNEFKTILRPVNVDSNVELSQTWYRDVFTSLSTAKCEEDIIKVVDIIKKAIENKVCEEPENLRIWSFINLISTDVPTRRRKRVSVQVTSRPDTEEIRSGLQILSEISIILTNYCYFRAFKSLDWNEFSQEEKLNIFKITNVLPNQPNSQGVYALLKLPLGAISTLSSDIDEASIDERAIDPRIHNSNRIFNFFINNLKNPNKV